MHSAAYRPDPRHPDLGPAFFDPVDPARFPKAILRFRNDRWAARVGLAGLSDEDWIDHFARFRPLPGNLPQPLALRYHGHQFRAYNPDLGDGRGFLFAQLRDDRGRLLDLGTKGSGQTPYSRFGDGRLTLKGAVREILATEMLEALGVDTSKTFSVIETGEALTRNDEPSPTRSAVLVRLSHSHIRIGTFQRLAALGETAEIPRLVDHVIAHYWPEADQAADRVLAFYRLVVAAVARTGADWFAAGFVHGVLNTDNIAITGESFDYGPWRFLPALDPDFTAAYFDQTGLYAFGRQPEALQWNLARLAECLLDLVPQAALEGALASFGPAFERRLIARVHQRLGLAEGDQAAALARVQALLGAMKATGAPFQQVFHDLAGGADPDRLAASPIDYSSAAWSGAVAALRDADPLPGTRAALAHPGAAPEQMLIEEVEALWSAIDAEDDWSPLEATIARIRRHGDFQRQLAGGA